jgi:hypothetical protein
MSVPVATRSKAWVCGGWSAGIEFESRRGHVCLSVSCVCCVLSEVSAWGWSLFQRSPTECGVSVCCQRSLRAADHSSRGVLLSVVCLCVVRGLCVGLITRPEESYWCGVSVCCQRSLRGTDHSSRGVLLSVVSECDRESLTVRRPSPLGAVASWEKIM